MWLPYRKFMTSALVVVVLVLSAIWSPMAISRLVDVNRGIAAQSLPVLLMGTALRPQLGGLLVRLPQDVASRRWAASAGGER